MAKTKTNPRTRLERSEAFRRTMRKDDWPLLGKNSIDLVKEAVRAGRDGEAVALADYLLAEGKALHDLYTDWTYMLLTFIAQRLGEEVVPEALRYCRDLLSFTAYQPPAGLALREIVQWSAEFMRSHRSGPGERGDIAITEDDEKYVMTFCPCGSGGRMRLRGELDGIPPRTGPPFSLGTTSKPYPWSWGKAGVPYYCVHCCLWGEIIPIEKRGYPGRITEYKDDPGAPCSFLFYKDPRLIPERYFTRLGFRKDPSRFK